jgi:hypothetical protein
MTRRTPVTTRSDGESTGTTTGGAFPARISMEASAGTFTETVEKGDDEDGLHVAVMANCTRYEVGVGGTEKDCGGRL